ncbi:MAG: GIY-YIG nuclease family protein [Planctomycetes bacterium]|nr:GIY-YIG nuclease family protein [Planctomycetota bacterium]
MGQFWVYVLRSSVTGRRYTGSCEDVDERLRRHNAEHSPATRHGVPWKLVHKESFTTRAEATRRERFLKTGRGRMELDAIEGLAAR